MSIISTKSQASKSDNALVPAPRKASALAVMASRVNVDPEKLLVTLKDTVFQKATNSELLALVVVANEYGLNPFLKEIYAFPAKGGGIVPVVSIDGWISMINRQSSLDGIEFSFQGEPAKPVSCTCVIHIKGRSHPVSVTEYFDECFRSTEPWKTMPMRMLRHKALIQCARVAFGFSGIYDEDEAVRIKDAKAHVVESRAEPLDPFSEKVTTLPENTETSNDVPTNRERSPQNRLIQSLADSDIKEGHFMKAAGLGGKMVTELTDEQAESLIAEFAEITAQLS